MSLLSDRAFSVRNLTAAWKKIYQRDAADGTLGQSVVRFQNNADEKLKELSLALLTATYAPAALTEVEIEKDGKERTLHIPAIQDRIVARAVLMATTPLIDPLLGGAAYGYRPGLGVSDAVQAVANAREAGHEWVLRTDIDDCFPTIPHDEALGRFSHAVRDTRLAQVVAQMLDRTIWNGPLKGTQLPGLPLGCPLSPALMNLVLVELDDALSTAGFTVIRYADDMAILGGGPEELEDAYRFSQRILGSFDMQLGEDKTEIMSFAEGFTFLGEDFGPTYPAALPLHRVEEPDSRVLYLGSQTSHIRLSKGRLIVEDRDKDKPSKLLDVPSKHVSRIVAFGSVAISGGVRSWAMQSGVDIALASRRGTYLGSITSANSTTHSARLVAQLGLQNTPRQLHLSREIVRAKIQKQVVVLQRFGRRESEKLLSHAIKRMRNNIDSLDNAESLDEIMGLEGAAAKEYFAAYGSLFPEKMRFKNRSRQPPRDIANAGLSFLYTVLLGECNNAIRATGMDPSIGVLHSMQGKRQSLALDLLEEFRPLIVDQVVLNAARKNRLTLEHARSDIEHQGILLNKKGREVALKAYEERMLQSVKGSLPDFTGSLRRHLYRQAQRLAGAIIHEDYEWNGMSWR